MIAAAGVGRGHRAQGDPIVHISGQGWPLDAIDGLRRATSAGEAVSLLGPGAWFRACMGACPAVGTPRYGFL